MSQRTPVLALVVLLFTATACHDGPSRPTATSVPPPPPPPADPPPPPAGPAVRVMTPAVPTSPTHPIVGQYSVELRVGFQCDSIPNEVRNRSYIATITFTGNYLITLSEASFLQDAACQQPTPPSGETPPVCNHIISAFDDFREGELWFAFSQKSPYQTKPIVEQLPGGAWLEVDGVASGPPQDDGTPTAIGTMTLSYWFGDPVGSSYVSCLADGARLVFTRR